VGPSDLGMTVEMAHRRRARSRSAGAARDKFKDNYKGRPMRRIAGFLTLLFPLTAHFSLLTAQGRAFTPKDWYRVTTLSSPAVSPDGKQVAFTVTTVRAAENKRHAEVWLVAAAGGEPARLTSPGVESSNPRWSPDGKLLLFAS